MNTETSLLINRLETELRESLALAASQVAAEKLAGNIAKEEYWKGELAVLTRFSLILSDNLVEPPPKLDNKPMRACSGQCYF
jgi:hypothetical protein